MCAGTRAAVEEAWGSEDDRVLGMRKGWPRSGGRGDRVIYSQKGARGNGPAGRLKKAVASLGEEELSAVLECLRFPVEPEEVAIG